LLSFKTRSKTILAVISVILPIYSDAQRGLYNGENVPITFYGKVVDQDMQPVPKATVSFEAVSTHYAVNSSEQEQVTIETDRDGKFIITGINGHAIDKIDVTKDGYELSSKIKRGYLYSFGNVHNPDATNPVIFKMWKKQGKELLVGSAWRGKVACDGTTNRFDLSHGVRGDSGNLETICTRTPLNYERTNGPSFSYKFEILLIDGGIQMTDDEFTYLAPDTGYLPSVTIERKPGDPQWRAGVDQEFYIKTSDGRYGRISVMWDAGHRPSPTILKWDCSINPSGSRNLER
jgi:hypothetical protein